MRIWQISVGTTLEPVLTNRWPQCATPTWSITHFTTDLRTFT